MIRKLEDELKDPLPGKLFLCMALFMEIIAFISRKSGQEGGEQRANFLIGDAIRYFALTMFGICIWPMTFKFFNKLGAKKN